MTEDWDKYREKIIGLGENSARKSYYPDLQEKISELEVARLYLHTLINSISDSIIIHDRDGRILFMNDQARRLINEDEREMAGNCFYDMIRPPLDSGELNGILDDVLNERSRTIECSIKPIDGEEETPVQISLNRTVWYGGVAVIAILRDFTERKRYEQALIAAREMAEENDRLKSIFLANLSHEIRTPMNAILGFTEILRSPDITQEERDGYIDIVRGSGEHLLSIINDIIEISRIEAGQAGLHNSVVNINTLMEEVYNSLRITLPKDKNIELRLFRQAPAPAETIVIDDVKLRQILINLINNAIKFTNEGSVSFGYEKISHNELKFTVRDTGIGIDPIHQKVVFERFRQVNDDVETGKRGSGLGLAISKAYAELMGGTIWLESVPGQGSVFYFTVSFLIQPKQHQEAEEMKEDKPFAGRNEVILIAEDDYYNYLYIEKLIGSNNFQLIRAGDGSEAVEICRNNNNIMLVLMDIKMPVMNGYEALMRIREINPGLPVVAQTAYALPEDLTRIRQEGFDGHLVKPIRREELYEVIRKYMNKKETTFSD